MHIRRPEMEKDLAGKKILILGGAFQHLKLVEMAKKMGIITYVTDYLEYQYSPAKQIADYWYMYDITEIDELVAMCRKEHIDGVIAPYLDVTQRPYQMLCERLGFPCFGDKKQHEILTNKGNFKRFWKEHGGDTIPYYREEDVIEQKRCMDKIKFPVLIKPCDSRGSRGQTICYSWEDAVKAIGFAKSQSRSGDVVIEKYMNSKKDLELVYIVIEGEPILVRVEDRYSGDPASGLDKLSIACIAPSLYEKKYREEINEKTISVIRDIGLKNSPVFLQGFMDGDRVYFYDPGIRFPGDDYDRIYESVTGIDLVELLIRFALTGKMSVQVGKRIKNAGIHKATAMIYPAVRPGRIAKIEGMEEIKKNPSIVAANQIYKVGDIVEIYNNVKQRFGEFDIECNHFKELKDTIEWLFEVLHVYDENGEDMLFAKFKTEVLNNYL